MREEAGENVKHQMVATSPTMIGFGHGRHAWYVHPCKQPEDILTYRINSPGRFFAANEIKCILAHIVTNYDVKFREGCAPESSFFNGINIPAPANIMFRRRQK